MPLRYSVVHIDDDDVDVCASRGCLRFPVAGGRVYSVPDLRDVMLFWGIGREHVSEGREGGCDLT